MKLFTKVMAAALLSTALSGVVMAADHDLGDGTILKSTVKLAGAKAPFGVTDAATGGGLSVLTVKPSHLKAIAALKEADFNDATVKQFLATYQGMIAAIVDNAEEKSLDKAIAALSEPAASGALTSEPFQFKKDKPNFGIPDAFVKGLISAVSPNPYATMLADTTVAGKIRILKELEATGKDKARTAGNDAKHASLREILAELKAIEDEGRAAATKPAQEVAAHRLADLLADYDVFTGGKKSTTIPDLHARYLASVDRAAYDAKKAQLKERSILAAEEAARHAAPAEELVLGGKLFEALLGAAGDSQLSGLLGTRSVKDKGITETHFDLATFKGHEEDVARALVAGLVELNDDLAARSEQVLELQKEIEALRLQLAAAAGGRPSLSRTSSASSLASAYDDAASGHATPPLPAADLSAAATPVKSVKSSLGKSRKSVVSYPARGSLGLTEQHYLSTGAGSYDESTGIFTYPNGSTQQF